jgi:magnesium transporter
MSETSTFKQLIKKFIEHDVVAGSNIIEGLSDKEASEVLEVLPPDLAARIIKNLQVTFAAILIEQAQDTFLQKVLPKLEPQFLTAILMHVSADARSRLKQYISGAIEEQIRDLLEYPVASVGRAVTTDFLSFDKSVVAKDAIGKIRSLSRKHRPASYAYVVDDQNHLLGVLNMLDLMIAQPGQTLESIMIKDVFSLHCFVDIQEAAADLARRKYFAAPVVDSENRMIGIIKAERLIKGIQDNSAQDLQRMFGAGREEKPFSSIFFSLKKRLFWLHINLITAFMAASVVALFEGIIAKLTILAVFLPVVAGQGGNAGAQSLAIVMRGLVMREIPKDKTRALILKEGGLGAINGLIIGIVTAIIAWAWYGNPYLGLVIGLGMLFNLIFAGLAGASIPLFMKRVGIDPAQSSSIILTTVTDVLGFFAFLGFAVLFQDLLV